MKALITGASSGIGKCMALYLDKLGYDLILVASTLEHLESNQNEFSKKHKLIAMDLSNPDNAYELYKKVKKDKISILINNAGFGLVGDFIDQDLDKELKMINLNCITPHILTKLFLKDMVKEDNGYILNVSSSAAFTAGPRLNTYYATKNYILRLTMAINEELRHMKSNVYVGSLCPGPTKTNFNKTAGAKGSLKEATPEYVAKYAIDKMFKKKMIILPGLKMKLGNFALRFMSYRQQLNFIYNQQTKKMKNNQ